MKATRFFGVLAIAASTSISMAQIVPNQYIAVFKGDVSDHPAAAQALAAQHGLAVSRVYQRALKGFAFRGSAQAAAALARRPQIAYVEPDQVFRAIGTLPTGIDRADVEQAIDIGTEEEFSLGNAGVTVTVLDTGASIHPDLNVVGGIRFYYNRRLGVLSDNNYTDGNGHGTHVSGTIGARDDGVIASYNGKDWEVVGVAPGIPIYAVKVLDDNGNGYTSVIVAGIDHVIGMANTIHVANMSLGGGISTTLDEAVRRGTQAGIVFVVAAGNEAADASSSSPAREPSAITVSALADSDGLPGGYGPATSYGADDSFASFSNDGAVVDICAPGVDILSTYLGGAYAIMSGTSMACPHVAGAAALYMARQAVRPDVAAVTAALLNSGWTSSEGDSYFTGDADGDPEPLLNVCRLMGVTPNSPPKVTIASPADGAFFESDTEITFTGTALDDVDGDLGASLLWTAKLECDGIPLPIGTGKSVTTSLADGTYTITASVADSSGVTGSASITVVVGTSSTIVVPPGYQCTEASGASGTIAFPLRLQEVYSASHFGDSATIYGMAFRMDHWLLTAAGGTGEASTQSAAATNQWPAQITAAPGVASVIGEDFYGEVKLNVRLSSTAKAPDALSSTFSENIGTSETVVFDGVATFTAGTGATPNGFDIMIHFQPPFAYDPGIGNLLVDITTYTAAPNASIDASNALNDGASRVHNSQNNSATTGTCDTGADVIQFWLEPPPNQAPAASFNYVANGLTVSFTDTSTDSDGAIAIWSWNLGDGSTSTDQNPSHVYAQAGEYTVTLTVTDNEGAPATTSAKVTVSTAPPALHCGDLDGIPTTVSRNQWKATVTVTIHDASHKPVSGALVTGAWSGGYIGTGTGMTSADGTCVVATPAIKTTKSSVTFTMTGVTAAGFIYNPSDNHDETDSDSSDGTTITVNKP